MKSLLFLETSVIFGKYIRLLVVTWKTLQCGEERRDSDTEGCHGGAAVPARVRGLRLKQPRSELKLW